METAHILPLAGLIESIDILGSDIRVDLVIIRRPEHRILGELMDEAEGPDPVVLDPGPTQTIVDPTPYLTEGRLGRCHWYATELASRASYYFHLLSKHPTVRVHWIGLETLRRPDGAAHFLAALGRPSDVTALRLLDGPAERVTEDDPAIRAIIERFPLQSRRRALGYLKAGRRLGT